VRHTSRHSYVTPLVTVTLTPLVTVTLTPLVTVTLTPLVTVTLTPQKPYVTHHSVPIDTVMCDVDWVSVCNDIANPFPSLYILKQIDASRNIVLNKYDGTYGSC
jgi:hypothetical protein